MIGLLRRTAKKALRLLGIKSTDWRFTILPYRPHDVAAQTWEAQYASNHWDYLKGVGERAHYSLIVGYCQFFNQRGSILDVGCGEGVLQEALRPYPYASYAGVDVSTEAIQRACTNQDDRTVFVCADVTNYTPQDRFDIIIFNESLYYLEDPLGVVKRYEGFLAEGGLIIVSMLGTHRAKRIWKMLDSSYTTEDAVLVSHRSGKSWNVRALRTAPAIGNSPPRGRVAKARDPHTSASIEPCQTGSSA